MGLAKVLGLIALIAGIMVWIYFLTNSYESYWDGERRMQTGDDLIGWTCLIFGILSYISSWMLYGFGQLVDDVSAIKTSQTIASNIAVNTSNAFHANAAFQANAAVQYQAPPSNGWRCSCGRVNADYVSTCACGAGKSQVPPVAQQ